MEKEKKILLRKEPESPGKTADLGKSLNVTRKQSPVRLAVLTQANYIMLGVDS